MGNVRNKEGRERLKKVSLFCWIVRHVCLCLLLLIINNTNKTIKKGNNLAKNAIKKEFEK